MFLNKNQERLLIEITKYKDTRSIASLGKKIYNTYISAYNNIELLKLYGYIDLIKRKNKITIKLTNKGLSLVKLILEKRKYLKLNSSIRTFIN